MPNPDLRLELSKLRLLEYLTLHEKDGLKTSKLSDYIRNRDLPEFPHITGTKGPYSDPNKSLPGLIESGLVEKREVADGDKVTNYYHITEAGKGYLDNAKQKAKSAEPESRQHWAAIIGRPKIDEHWAKSLDWPTLDGMIADVLRRQSEFQGNPYRAVELSKEIADELLRGKKSEHSR